MTTQTSEMFYSKQNKCGEWVVYAERVTFNIYAGNLVTIVTDVTQAFSIIVMLMPVEK